jgi:cytochrome c556
MTKQRKWIQTGAIAATVAVTFIATICSVLLSPAAAQSAPKVAPGHVLIPAAQRMAVQLTEPEREYILNEMRAQLDMLYIMSEGLSRKDLATVAAAAKRRGSDALNTAPAAVFERTPAPFRDMIIASRAKIDQIAVEAQNKVEPEVILKRTTELLQLCNSCHAEWQLKVIAASPPRR